MNGLDRGGVAILGAGPIGLACALLLSARGIGSQLIDARSLEQARQDRRLLALSRGTLQLLSGPLGTDFVKSFRSQMSIAAELTSETCSMEKPASKRRLVPWCRGRESEDHRSSGHGTGAGTRYPQTVHCRERFDRCYCQHKRCSSTIAQGS